MKSEIKKQELRNQILLPAINLFQTRGFEETSMEEIARQAYITKRTLYKYFPVKEAIIEEYIRQTLSSKNEERTRHLLKLKGLEKRVTWYLRELMEGVMREPVLFEKYLVYLMQKMVSPVPDRGRKPSGAAGPVLVIIEKGLEEGEINRNLPLPVIIDLFLFAFVETAKIYYADPESFSLKDSVRTTAGLFTKGVS